MPAAQSPTDAAFRRALFVMLLVVGLLSAGAFISVRDAQDGLEAARQAQQDAERERRVLLSRLDEVLEGQEAALAERDRLNRRSLALERIVVALLADSDNPEIADAFEEFQKATEAAEAPQP